MVDDWRHYCYLLICGPVFSWLVQFRKQYPDIYSRRVPASDREEKKPKIKPPLLTIRRSKAFGIRN